MNATVDRHRRLTQEEVGQLSGVTHALDHGIHEACVPQIDQSSQSIGCGLILSLGDIPIISLVGGIRGQPITFFLGNEEFPFIRCWGGVRCGLICPRDLKCTETRKNNVHEKNMYVSQKKLFRE